MTWPRETSSWTMLIWLARSMEMGVIAPPQQISWMFPVTETRLLAIVQDPHQFARREAGIALFRVESQKLAPILLQQLKSPDKQVRRSAFGLIGAYLVTFPALDACAGPYVEAHRA